MPPAPVLIGIRLRGVVAQAESEWEELKEELGLLSLDVSSDLARVQMEFGDVLFTMINVARLIGIHPERALSQSTLKFINRFKKMESMAAAQGKRIDEVPRQEMELFWAAAKRTE